MGTESKIGTIDTKVRYGLGGLFALLHFSHLYTDYRTGNFSEETFVAFGGFIAAATALYLTATAASDTIDGEDIS